MESDEGEEEEIDDPWGSETEAEDGYEEELKLQYMTFDRHVLVWVCGEAE